MKHLLYLYYWVEWKLTHWGKLYNGMCPVCYEEFLDWEYAERWGGK